MRTAQRVRVLTSEASDTNCIEQCEDRGAETLTED